MADRRATLLKWTFILTPFVTMVLLATDEWLRRGSSSRVDIVAGLSLGSNGPLQIAYGVTIAVFAIAFHVTAAEPQTSTRVRNALLGVALACGAAGFLADEVRPVAEWTTRFQCHVLCSIAVVIGVPIALFLAYDRFHKSSTWRPTARWTLAAAAIAAVATIRLFAFPSPHLMHHAPMSAFLLSRATVLVLLVWGTGIAVWKYAPRSGAAITIHWEQLAAKVEVISVPLVLIGGIIALLEYCDTHRRDRRETASKAYEKADTNWLEYLKLCADHPDADCYSGEQLDDDDTDLDLRKGESRDLRAHKLQTRLVHETLIDTLEVAFVNYNDPDYAAYAPREYCLQWTTWVVAMRKFTHRRAFRRTWSEVGDEYDTSFQKCVDAVIDEQTGVKARADWASKPVAKPKRTIDSTDVPEACRLYDCPNE